MDIDGYLLLYTDWIYKMLTLGLHTKQENTRIGPERLKTKTGPSYRWMDEYIGGWMDEWVFRII